MKTKSGEEILHRDMGEWPIKDEKGVYQAYRSHYKIAGRDCYTVVSKSDVDVRDVSYRRAEEIKQVRAAGIDIDESTI